MRKSVYVIVFAFVSGIAGAFTFHLLLPKQVVLQNGSREDADLPANVQNVSYQSALASNEDMIKSSSVSTPCVVFIKTISQQQIYNDPFMDFWSNMDFFGRRGPVTSSGSGVIISSDGYIVTNLHVVKGADQIEVITNNNKHSYKAKLIGIDGSTDLALLKIDTKNLAYMSFGNSDNLKIGEWVLAVGNPFNLTSTVTAGIVSAKGRNINVVNNRFPIESFIQTDAAINPGNSGGALVNLQGELVGINTAIASNTGAYNGYGFAIPANIVSKIVKDLIEFNEVQRGFPGIDVKDIDAGLADQLNINDNLGVYVSYVLPGGPSDEAGIKNGDVIVKVNEKSIDSKAIFDEQISYFRPGDKLKLSILRSSKPFEMYIKLINREGNTAILKKQYVSSATLGADFQMISKVETEKFGVRSGIKIINIRNGRIQSMGIPEEFIITSFNRKEYQRAEDLIKDLETTRGQLLIEGIHPNGSRGFYSFYTN
ncbi:MAG: trypsin-like peptidase domain-containing protein [Bacteroidia bacterium]|jgi:Do/DeqQ family serine protease